MSTTNQQKFQNQHPIQQRLIHQFHQRFLQVLVPLQPKRILEVGCGEGYLLEKIHRAVPTAEMLGVDNNQLALEEGRRIFPQLQLERGDIYHLPQPDHSWDVVIASEVLEHLDHPEQALEELKRVSSRYVVLSVPHEPWFRLGNLARGRHLKRLGNHPEHINLWSRAKFARFVGQHLNVKTVTGSFPWTLIVAEV